MSRAALSVNNKIFKSFLSSSLVKKTILFVQFPCEALRTRNVCVCVNVNFDTVLMVTYMMMQRMGLNSFSTFGFASPLSSAYTLYLRVRLHLHQRQCLCQL